VACTVPRGVHRATWRATVQRGVPGATCNQYEAESTRHEAYKGRHALVLSLALPTKGTVSGRGAVGTLWAASQ
jgi:hypothetical protein